MCENACRFLFHLRRSQISSPSSQLKMTLTQFAMVEELAYLVKDNLPCKHLILSMEEAFVNILQDDHSYDGNLELEPMNSYNRLLMHRLADIFGFSHESVGEGDDRHLILERNPETSIPSILVSDILWEFDETPTLETSHHLLLRRKEAPPVVKTRTTLQHTYEQREAAYLAARERIFKTDAEETVEPVRQKPRNIPVVARRMIAHALGQRIKPSTHDFSVGDCKESEGETNEDKDKYTNSSSEGHTGIILVPDEDMHLLDRAKTSVHNHSTLSIDERKAPQKPGEKRSTNVSISQNGSSGNGVSKDSLKEERLGAAKRMFALALGRNSIKDGFHSKSSGIK